MSEVVREVIKRSLDHIEEYGHYYPHDATCGNCGDRQHAYILKGRSLKGLDIECGKCGCIIRLLPFGANWSEK